MARRVRADIAKETLNILDQGFFLTPSGTRRDIREGQASAENRSIYYQPGDLESLQVPNGSVGHQQTVCVTNESTLAAAARLVGEGETVLALNFASAKNPGGGFLGGSQAQEESLARSSGLYSCLLKYPAYYEYHRAHRNLLYSDRMIYSPAVPVFRNDDGALLERPYQLSILTVPAPNAGAASRNQPERMTELPIVFAKRAELVLRVAAYHQYHTLVLGAWGCGVFQNDPNLVADIFAKLLAAGYQNRFKRVVFAIYGGKAKIFSQFHETLATVPGFVHS